MHILTNTLQAKTFAVDGRYLYVGSFNFDPSSADLNTKRGVIIDNAELAGQLRTVLEADNTPRLCCPTKRTWQSGSQTRGDDGELHSLDKEPEESLFRRVQVWASSRLPID